MVGMLQNLNLGEAKRLSNPIRGRLIIINKIWSLMPAHTPRLLLSGDPQIIFFHITPSQSGSGKIVFKSSQVYHLGRKKFRMLSSLPAVGHVMQTAPQDFENLLRTYGMFETSIKRHARKTEVVRAESGEEEARRSCHLEPSGHLER